MFYVFVCKCIDMLLVVEFIVYFYLFILLDLGFIQFCNCVLMGFMYIGLEDWVCDFFWLVVYFVECVVGGVGLIVIGGFVLNVVGWFKLFGGKLFWLWEVCLYCQVICVVYDNGGWICLQLLYVGCYVYYFLLVVLFWLKVLINLFILCVLLVCGVDCYIVDYVCSVWLVCEVGYDGVEVMGLEGYLINEFIVLCINQCIDCWGGDVVQCMCFVVEIVCCICEVCGLDFIIIYWLLLVDLVDNGSNWEEIVQQVQVIEVVGVILINLGIGWYEVCIFIIVILVLCGVFVGVIVKFKLYVCVLLIVINWINMLDVVECILVGGGVDMVFLVCLLLVDLVWVNKVCSGCLELINICIVCNQVCLDYVFENKIVSCLVNLWVVYEIELVYCLVVIVWCVVVVGVGLVGLVCVIVVVECGYWVMLFDVNSEIGGQFNVVKCIFGKEEFYEILCYFGYRLVEIGVELKLGIVVDVVMLVGFDVVVVVIGIILCQVDFFGVDYFKVVSYLDVLFGWVVVGLQVVIIGVGGIGFDVGEFLVYEGLLLVLDMVCWMVEWGVDLSFEMCGVLM